MLKFIILAASCMLVMTASPPYKRAEDCVKELPECGQVDLSFVVDASASISQNNFTMGLWFIQDFVDQLNIGPNQVRVSVVTYSHQVHKKNAFGFDAYTNKDSLKRAIADMKYYAGRRTETGAALRYYLDRVRPKARKGVRSVVVVMTDGEAHNERELLLQSKRARDDGVEVFAIGIGTKISSEELFQIASEEKNVFLVPSYNTLYNFKNRLTDGACRRGPEPECKHLPIDVSFVLDSSRSITKENFKLEMNFIKEFLDVFEINPSSTRVAAIMFGHRVYSEWAIPFDKYKNKKDTVDAILRLPYMNGAKTETSSGINYMIKHFVPKFRANASHIGIIITDGGSQRTSATKAAAQKARDAGITTVAVRVGKIRDKKDREELEALAGDPSRLITATNFHQLNTIREGLTTIVCRASTRK